MIKKKDKDGRTTGDRKLSVLGCFMYHHTRVTLQASADERDYVVKEWEWNWKHKEKRPKPTKITLFSDLRIARRFFEDRVDFYGHSTSLSDVSLFMQQYS